MISEQTISQYEMRLREAMLASDVGTLDELLAPDLIFTSHLGQIFTKEDDLEGHRSGNLKIEAIALLEEKIKLVGEVAIVSAKVRILGSFLGVKSEDDFRFTRLWKQNPSGAWQIIAGHSSIVV